MRTARPKAPLALALAGALVLPLLIAAGTRAPARQDKLPPAKPVPPGPQWTIESHDKTNFPLVGQHRTLSCRDCHLNLVFEGTPTDCEACHWQRRQDDRYALRLGTQCAECHTPQSWKRVDPALWSHEVDAGYRLEGVHRTLDCEACHGSGGFTGQPGDCYACHEADYRGADDPDHVQAGFPTDCASCHDQRAWENAGFAHADFPLQGRHAAAACADCHEGGVYAGTPTDCSACHLDDYNAATDPDHQSAGFPLDCTEWTGADLDHQFPIASGRHSGNACSECHTTSDYRVFSCLGCHAQSSTNSNHQGVSGYSYSSLACYSCHPNGQAAPSTAPRSLW
jgi:hypothetical protein